MGIIVAVLAVIVALIFWYVQKQEKKQAEWRRQKEMDIARKRANLRASRKAETDKAQAEEE